MRHNFWSAPQVPHTRSTAYFYYFPSEACSTRCLLSQRDTAANLCVSTATTIHLTLRCTPHTHIYTTSTAGSGVVLNVYHTPHTHKTPHIISATKTEIHTHIAMSLFRTAHCELESYLRTCECEMYGQNKQHSPSTKSSCAAQVPPAAAAHQQGGLSGRDQHKRNSNSSDISGCNTSLSTASSN